MEDPLAILQQYWGHDSFRDPQEDIIRSVMSGKDTLALLPTGGGKSICFQVPTLAQEGMALVISPLIALMKDQVERLNKMGIAAAFINSSQPRKLQDQKLQMAMDGGYKFLYLAPERIRSDMFRLRLPAMKINVLAIDEAHCISQWGFDFRPDYLHIHEIRERLPGIPIIALTASASPQVQQDIQEKLLLQEPRVFQKSFRRENLRYFVLDEENTTQRIDEILSRTQGSGIIYVRTRKRAEKFSHYLRGKGHLVGAYHGGLMNSQREVIQEEWVNGKIRVMIATNAFGMGIDKPDVRFVVHLNLPFDLESYYQEAGRGGRDGKTALAIAFNNPVDIREMEKWNQEKYPTWEMLKRHYLGLCTHFRIPADHVPEGLFPFDVIEIAKILNTSPIRLLNSINILQKEGLLYLQEDKDDFGYIQVLLKPSDVLAYKDSHPQQAELIDFVLRKLGGESYGQETRFLLHRWATELREEPSKMNEKLIRLAKLSVLHYIEPRGAPALSFSKARHRLSKQALDWDKYIFLKKRSEHRLQAMLSYAQGKTICRSLSIEQYFGEQSHVPCGKCDVCIGRHKTKVSDKDYKKIQHAILDFVKQGEAITYRDVLLKLNIANPNQREKVLRYLMDKDIVQVDVYGNLSLN